MIIFVAQCVRSALVLKHPSDDNPYYDFDRIFDGCKVDLVVIGSRGRSSAREIFFGSTSQFVLHKVKSPVLVIK